MVFFILFPFPKFGNGFFPFASRSRTSKCHSRSPLSSFPSLHLKVTFWKGSNIQRLHLQPVRSTECCSKRAEIPRPKQFKSPGSISKLSGLPILPDLFVPIFPIFAIFTQGVGQSMAADLDNQQDWATNVPLPSSASATRKRELLKLPAWQLLRLLWLFCPTLQLLLSEFLFITNRRFGGRSWNLSHIF